MATDKVKRGVLSDHKRQGKKFIPPFLFQLGPLRETSWVNTTMLELIWIACLQHVLGFSEGTALAVALSGASLKHCPDHKGCFLSTSDFYGLSKAGQLAVVDEMRTQGYLEGIQRSIGPLHYLYPDSPFDFLVHEWSRFDSHKSEIEAMKTILRPLFDKRTREAMMVQGAGVYLGFVQGRLKLATDSALCEFPELENYPMTEKSKVIASAVAATIPILISMPDRDISTWPSYFWNRGLLLDDCEVYL